MSTIDEIAARANAATPGPWFWWGNAHGPSPHLYLFSQAFGRYVVMSFQRWGWQSAQPVFRDPETNILVPAQDVVRYQVCHEATSANDERVYRKQVDGIRHPDAEFIAHARTDIDTLLARVQELEEALAQKGPRS